MTPLKRWLRRTIERLLKRWYEGEEPPDRLGDMIVQWANENPNATRGEFLSMAIQITEESWMSGFSRGVEYVERDPEFFEDRQPDTIADAFDPTWREESPAITLDGDPNEIVPPDEVIEFEDLTVDLNWEATPDEYRDDRDGPSFVDT